MAKPQSLDGVLDRSGPASDRFSCLSFCVGCFEIRQEYVWENSFFRPFGLVAFCVVAEKTYAEGEAGRK